MARLHIFNRVGAFYWRRRLPPRIAAAFGREQLRLSLTTRNPKEARRLACLASLRFEQFLALMQLQKRMPTKDEQEDILRELYRLILEECAMERSRIYVEEEVPQDAQVLGHDESETVDPVPQEFRDRQSFFAWPKLSAEKMRAYQAENRFAPIRTLLAPLAERHALDHALDIESDDLAFRQFHLVWILPTRVPRGSLFRLRSLRVL